MKEIDEMIGQLLGMDLVGDDDMITFSDEAKLLIHNIAEKCSGIPIVQETQKKAVEYASGLSAAQVYTDMLHKIVEASTSIHMRMSARILIPIIDQKLCDSEMEG